MGVLARSVPTDAGSRRQRSPGCRRVCVEGRDAVTAVRLHGLLDRFAGRSVVVVGDLIVDEYLYGKPARISREAPVLILRFTEREARLGGAANASHNVHTLGARVVPIGVVGTDAAGEEMFALLRAAGIPTDG